MGMVSRQRRIILRLWLTATVLAALQAPVALAATAATATDISGPAGSGTFGQSVTSLSNGNIVVTDPLYTAASTAGAGAAYLYDGGTRAFISTMPGSSADDQVSSGGVVTLTDGNYVVLSPNWANSGAAAAGAATWCSRTSGCNVAPSASNSVVGNKANDQVGSGGVVPLANGNYLVVSYNWANGSAFNAGAVTWCPAGGCGGLVVSTTNSLVGSSTGDQIGSDGVVVLANGSYAVASSSWDTGGKANVGAVTWCPATGCTGAVSVANSLIGHAANDLTGFGGVTALSNGNYVVASPNWANVAAASAGAVTRCSGSVGCSGVISPTTSLVGSATSDLVGSGGVVAVGNGAYAVVSPNWNAGGPADAGAVTWCPAAGCGGLVVSSTNSLVGGDAGDKVGIGGVVALGSGRYAVASPLWIKSGHANVGAVTWCPASGCAGTLAPASSLVGSIADDLVGVGGIVPLGAGAYAVASPNWDAGVANDVGAVTWCPAGGCLGIAVTSTNSLVGTASNDLVSLGGVAATGNGSYAVASPNWAKGGTAAAGAATLCPALGCGGLAVSASNSLMGTVASDQVGSGGIVALTNGDYLVISSDWANGGASEAGAATLCPAAGCPPGSVTPNNSLVGGATGDRVAPVTLWRSAPVTPCWPASIGPTGAPRLRAR